MSKDLLNVFQNIYKEIRLIRSSNISNNTPLQMLMVTEDPTLKAVVERSQNCQKPSKLASFSTGCNFSSFDVFWKKISIKSSILLVHVYVLQILDSNSVCEIIMFKVGKKVIFPCCKMDLKCFVSQKNQFIK